VLAPTRLSAEEALDLYPYRWSVERMFFDLKEVLNLNRLYAANPNAVAMQVYAAAIVYNALRVAQSDGAAQVGGRPNDSRRRSSSQSRHGHLSLPASTTMGTRDSDPVSSPPSPTRRWPPALGPSGARPVQVEHRDDHRRTRRFCPARRHWKSFAHVRGGRRFTKLS